MIDLRSKKRELIAGAVLLLLCGWLASRGSADQQQGATAVALERATLRTFRVEVHSVGELEAARSNLIFSALRGDQGKIIHLVGDGEYVKPGDLLVKMDPTPFEEAISDLEGQIREQQCKIEALERALESEICHAEHEIKTAEFEVRCANLELEKVVKGDGPQELARLQAVMQKALIKYEEFDSYSSELIDLEAQGFLNASEIVLAKKKLAEEKEAYDIAKMEYDTVVDYVHPMRVEKAKTALQRAECKLEEASRQAEIKVARDRSLLEHAQYALADLKGRLYSSHQILALTDIKAPSQGIVVHREEFRNGQRRKPRLGDVLVRNQPILDLPDLDSMIVKTKVREVDLFKIAIGKPAIVAVDAYPQLTLHGKISTIGVLALTDVTKMGDEKYFDVQIELEQGDFRLRPGMTARVVILAETVENSLSIPLYAVHQQGRQSYCYVPEGGKFAIRPIVLGPSSDHWVVVNAGLHDGEEVCLHTPTKGDIIGTVNGDGSVGRSE
jgi:HlyD family secretion protein